MAEFNPFPLVPAIIALQFVVFGWRIAREISLGEARRRTWLLASDYVNLLLMLAVVITCVVIPLKTNILPTTSRATLAAAYVFMCFTPFVMAGHYRIFSRLGRTIYDDKPDYPWITDQEWVLLPVASLAASAAAYFVLVGW